MELRGYVQRYNTGQLGGTSIVANLHWTPKNKKRKIDETSDLHYAELWIGTNPRGEATFRKTGIKLSKFIEKHPHVLGISSYAFKDKFPFLLKVLSIASPTPIMIHLNERLASKLHNQNPSVLPDSMHRPVLIVALSDLEVILGFRPKNEIISSLKDTPELNELIKPKILEDFITREKSYYLKKVLECYLNTKQDKLAEAMDKYFTRMKSEDYITRDSQFFDFVEKSHKILPYDQGIFMIFFLNHFTLKKDESIYIPPLVPYSFLYGDAIECTTNSNNEIPIAFTSDNKEVSLFIECADFTSYKIDQLKIKPSFEPYFTIYDCDEDEFILSKVTISKDEFYTIGRKRSPYVFIILQGTALTIERTKIKTGTIMLVPPCHSFHLKAVENVTMFMAEPNLVI